MVDMPFSSEFFSAISAAVVLHFQDRKNIFLCMCPIEFSGRGSAIAVVGPVSFSISFAVGFAVEFYCRIFRLSA